MASSSLLAASSASATMTLANDANVSEDQQQQTHQQSALISSAGQMPTMVQPICKLQHVDPQQLGLGERVWACAWRHCGQLLATAGEDRTTKLWKCSMDLGMEDNNQPSENGSVTDQYPGTAATKDDPVQLLCSLRGDQSRAVRWVCFSPCGRLLATASFDATILIYERWRTTGEWEELHRLEGHESEVKCAAFSVSGHYLATCSRDKSVWVWKVEDDEAEEEGGGDADCEVLSILQQHTADVKFVVWHPREDILLSGGYDCSLRFYTFDGDDWTTAQALAQAHDETIWAAAFEPALGQQLATVGGDRAVKIWTRSREKDPEKNWHTWTKTLELPLLDCRWPLYTVAWSKPPQQHQHDTSSGDNNGILAVGGGDRLLRFFAFDEENVALRLVDSMRMESEINCVSWRPPLPTRPSKSNSSPQLAVALDDGNVHLLQLKLTVSDG